MVNAMKEGASMKYSGPCYQQLVTSAANAAARADAGDPSATQPVPLEIVPPEACVFLRHHR